MKRNAPSARKLLERLGFDRAETKALLALLRVYLKALRQARR